jgi:hypothetical protein
MRAQLRRVASSLVVDEEIDEHVGGAKDARLDAFSAGLRVLRQRIVAQPIAVVRHRPQVGRRQLGRAVRIRVAVPGERHDVSGSLRQHAGDEPLDVAVILLAPGGTMVRESGLASMISATRFDRGRCAPRRQDHHVLLGIAFRSRTAPGSTSDTATAKLPARVIQCGTCRAPRPGVASCELGL